MVFSSPNHCYITALVSGGLQQSLYGLQQSLFRINLQDADVHLPLSASGTVDLSWQVDYQVLDRVSLLLSIGMR